MLEQYFVKPATIDRLRGSWIAAEIETLPGLAGRARLQHQVRLAPRPDRVRLRRVRCVREGRSAVGELPAHVEAFVAERVARHDARTGSTRPMAKEVRGPVEQMLSVVLPGFEPTGRPHHAQPFADVAPGFFDYLVEERGLRPASLLAIATTSTGSRPTCGGSASSRSGSSRRRS